MEEEARRKNYILSWIFSEMRLNRVDQMESLKDKFKFISDTINYAYRKKGSNKGSLFDDTEINSILNAYGIAWNKPYPIDSAKNKCTIKYKIRKFKIKPIN